jgi:hypothetical protein
MIEGRGQAVADHRLYPAIALNHRYYLPFLTL